jgi:hypothetical protein
MGVTKKWASLPIAGVSSHSLQNKKLLVEIEHLAGSPLGYAPQLSTKLSDWRLSSSEILSCSSPKDFS